MSSTILEQPESKVTAFTAAQHKNFYLWEIATLCLVSVGYLNLSVVGGVSWSLICSEKMTISQQPKIRSFAFLSFLSFSNSYHNVHVAFLCV